MLLTIVLAAQICVWSRILVPAGTDRLNVSHINTHWVNQDFVPRYFLELYRRRQNHPAFRNQRNTLTAYFPEGGVEETISSRSYELLFNLSRLSSERMKAAKLRVLKRKSTCALCTRSYKILVYSIFGNLSKMLPNDGSEVFLVSTTVLNSTKSEWLEFNITSVVHQMKMRGENLFRFRLIAKGDSHTELRIGKDGKHRPFLLVYTRENDASLQEFFSQLGTALVRNLQKNVSAFADKTAKVRDIRSTCKQHCRRIPFRVHFSELRWNRWILAPSSYWANYCGGKCPRSLSYSFDPSNHAILQNIVHYSLDRTIPKASCVPTKLRSLIAVVLNADYSITSTHVQGMTVASCGCR